VADAWNPIVAPCDYILLAGQRSPGLAEVRGASSKRRWDEREGFGLSGAFSVFKGRGLASFSVFLRLYTEQDWRDWYAWKPLVDRLPTKRSGSKTDTGALDILHPYLEALDIRAVGVAEVMQPDQTGDGEHTIEIKFLEFRHPKLTLAKPEGSEATPVDPIERDVIAPLTKQFNELADE
jgi:hypothetical protein